MRKSSAEHASQQSSGAGRGVTQRFRGGSSEDYGRPSMTTRRGTTNRGWEIRLGALQVVVWLGLAIGAVFGAYFIGFFSGRYVGFEAARTASGVEAPKLALNDDFSERSKKGWDDVYGRLGGSAGIGSAEKGAAEPVKQRGTDQRIGKAVQERPQEAAQRAQEVESAVVVKRDPISDPEAIFNQDLGGAAAVVDDSVSKEISGKGGEVRVLGREADAVGAPGAEVEALSVVKRNAVEVPAKREAPVKVTKPVETKKEKVSVVKRLPKGYFAQVAAPKTKGEAEALARKLRKSGFPVILEDNSTGRSPFYRVMVGPEDNKVQADRMLAQLKREKYLDGKIFIRQVK